METINVYNLSEMPTAALSDFQELQEDFKLYDEEKNRKLQQLILTRGFKYAFKAWMDENGVLWIIDAHQRKRALEELQKRGYEVPPIPYEIIFAENKQDAVKEIAAYNSQFATLNPDTILFEKYDISGEDLQIFSLELAPLKLNMEQPEGMDWDNMGKIPEHPDTPDGGYKIKYEIIFDDEAQQERWYQFVGELKSRYADCETIAERIIQFIEEHE